MNRLLGAHVSAAGGLKNAIKRGQDFDLNAIQTMFSAPMRWAMKEIDPEQVKEMAVALVDSDIKSVLFHGIYLINLARQDKQKFHLSKASLKSHIDAVHLLEQEVRALGGEDIDIQGVTFHPGSAKDLEPEEGIKRIAQGLDWIADKTDGGMILLESAAGAGNVMGSKLEELAAMYENTEESTKPRVKYVLDTQHMHASGYDWENNIDEIVTQIDNLLGLDNVVAFHLNDSIPPLGSNKDRHENLGEGEIGMQGVLNVLNHPKLKDKPFYLETPALKKVDTATAEIEKLKDIAEG